MTQSSAVLEITSYLCKPWCYLYYLSYIPQVIRDLVYRIVASNRYLIFGKKGSEACPYNAGLRHKSIDWGEEIVEEGEVDSSRVKEV